MPSNPTASQLMRAMLNVGHTQGQAAALLSVTRRTFQHWTCARNKMPLDKWVEYLVKTNQPIPSDTQIDDKESSFDISSTLQRSACALRINEIACHLDDRKLGYLTGFCAIAESKSNLVITCNIILEKKTKK